MNAREFLGLEPTHNPFRWVLRLKAGLCNWSGNLFGGAGLGAAIAAMESVTDRPVVWATAQYVAHAMAGEVLDLDVTIAAEGRSTSQARVIARVGNKEILTVMGALGSRATPGIGEYSSLPDVPPPADCPPRTYSGPAGQSINAHLEMRMAYGRAYDELDGRPSTNGRCGMWARMPGVSDVSAAGLAILGDWVPMGIGQALGARAGGSSLDNTLRVVRLVPTEWVLLDIRVHAIHTGFGHGLVHLWAQDGTLLGTASQSVALRYHDDGRQAIENDHESGVTGLIMR